MTKNDVVSYVSCLKDLIIGRRMSVVLRPLSLVVVHDQC